MSLAPAEPVGAGGTVLALVGPTGVGKTAVAVALAGALPIEAVSVDSRQVYRGLDIGSGKPTPAERHALPHHLIDVVTPNERYDAARFAREAAAAIADIRGRGRLPILVGGTGLYYRALVRGLAPLPPGDPALRARLRAEAATAGGAALHRRLARADPEAAARLHPRDVVRLTRALEVVTLTGRPLSASLPRPWHGVPNPDRVLAIGLTTPREVLYARLGARVDGMVASGLLAEVEALLAAGFGPDLPAMQGIGYRHLVPVLTAGASLVDALRAMKRDTRRYAKRQWTWFRREPGIHWIRADLDDAGNTARAVKKVIGEMRAFDYPGPT